VNEASAGKLYLRGVVHRMGILVSQIALGADRTDFVAESPQVIVPLSMLFHEYVDLAPARRTGTENQHVAL